MLWRDERQVHSSQGNDADMRLRRRPPLAERLAPYLSDEREVERACNLYARSLLPIKELERRLDNLTGITQLRENSKPK